MERWRWSPTCATRRGWTRRSGWRSSASGGWTRRVAAAGAIAGGSPAWEADDATWDALLGTNLTAKHGVVGLVRALAAELGPHGATANAVAPGSTDTAMLAASAAIYDLPDPAAFAEHHRIPRLLRAEEVAAAIAWLCGPDTAGVTGTVLPVDAGMTA